MPQSFASLRSEMQSTLRKIIDFWLTHSIDAQYGGFLTCFDEHGSPTADTNKYLVTQCHMLWGFSYLTDFCAPIHKEPMQQAAMQGLEFLIKHFWDDEHGGFGWKTDRAGTMEDNSKLIYGQSIAMYALTEYYRQYKDARAMSYVEKLFYFIQVYAADTQNGGYYENLEPDWSPSAGGVYAGERKSLDVHMHLMMAFTALYTVLPMEIYARKLKEIVELIMSRMINSVNGFGYGQLDAAFNRIPSIKIHRTWSAERQAGEVVEAPTDTTSYGHNIGLSWLLTLALETINAGPYQKLERGYFINVVKGMVDHSIRRGYDHEYGGVFYEGTADNRPLVSDKEWWHNFEALVGYANGCVYFKEDKYPKALRGTWEFIRDKFIVESIGESRQLLTRTGEPIVSDIGNPWKGIYHTGRALAETILRLNSLITSKKTFHKEDRDRISLRRRRQILRGKQKQS